MSNRLKSYLSLMLLPLVKLLRHLFAQVSPAKSNPRTSLDLVREEALVASASFISQNLDSALLFDSRKELWSYAITKAEIPGIFAEFGVWQGKSINQIARLARPQTVYGFDSFLGLTEDWWGTALAEGHFNELGRLPEVEENVVLIPGLFAETVPTFCEENSEPFSFVHFDADTFPSTKFLLEEISSLLRPGSVLVFDNFHGFPNWWRGEKKALEDVSSEMKWTSEFIGFGPNQAAVRIVEFG